MRAINHLQRLACMAALVLGLLLACSALAAPPAHATSQRAEADSASLTLTNGTTFTFASTPAPLFQVVVTLAKPESGNRIYSITVQLENGQQFHAGEPPAMSADQLTYTWSVSAASDNTGQPIPAGAHTAIASFTNPDTGVPTQSNAVSFTIARKSLQLACSFPGQQLFRLKPGIQAQITLSSEFPVSPPVNWTEGTASVTFTGPSTITIQSLHPDSNGVITVTTPSVVGRYNFACHFSGSADYAASDLAWTTYPLLVSEMSQLGGMRLYSNPTTFVASQNTEFYIVFEAAPGLPTPTGQFTLSLGPNPIHYYTHPIDIGPHGDALFTLQGIPNFTGSESINVDYLGDAYYNDQTYSFPATNPAIPGGSGGSGGSGGGAKPAQPKATATAHAKATASGAASATATDSTTPTATATPASGHAILSATTSPLGGALGWLVAALVGLLVLGGVVGGAFFWRSRRKAASLVTASGSPTHSPLDDVTLPHRTPDH